MKMNGWIVCRTWEVVLENGMADDEFGGVHEAVPKGRVVTISERVRFWNSGG